MSRLRVDNRFIEDANWHKQEEAYITFYRKMRRRKLSFGAGRGLQYADHYQVSFERLNQILPNASLIRVNLEDPEREGILTFHQDMQEVVSAWKN